MANKGLLVLLGIGVAAVAVYYATKSKAIVATGEKVYVLGAFASISGKLTQAWVQRGSKWFMYAPGPGSDSDLTYVQGGEYIQLQVTQNCILTYSGQGYNINKALITGWNTISWK